MISVIETLQRLTAKTLERRRRRGHYALIWQGGKPVLTGEDAPRTNEGTR
jgi:hypothetical protein